MLVAKSVYYVVQSTNSHAHAGSNHTHQAVIWEAPLEIEFGGTRRSRHPHC